MKYPKETEGSRMARKVREQCNAMSNAERQRLYERGMAQIRRHGNRNDI